MNTTTNQRQYKYLTFYVTAFIACYLTQAVLLNRLVNLGGFYITGGTFIYFLSPLITDVITEVYGYRIARQVLWQGLFAVAFLSLCVNICIRAPYPPFWAHVASAYSTALYSLGRSTIVGFLAVIAGQVINIYLISKWKILWRGKYFWLRSVGSSIIGDTITVSIAISGVFAHRVPAHTIYSLLFPELIVMIVFSSLGALPAWVLAKITAKAENLNTYDTGINYNPFKLSTKD